MHESPTATCVGRITHKVSNDLVGDQTISTTSTSPSPMSVVSQSFVQSFNDGVVVGRCAILLTTVKTSYTGC